ncbi:MAG TPA: type II toxin-antitoxin system RelE/ParE family toxin [Beijerinckiaceae bacterium]
MNVVLSARAERDVERLWAFLASRNPRAADRFLHEIERAYRSLGDFPERGRPVRGRFRELVLPFGRGAYVLRYTVSAGRRTVVVVRVWHGRESRP